MAVNEDSSGDSDNDQENFTVEENSLLSEW